MRRWRILTVGSLAIYAVIGITVFVYLMLTRPMIPPVPWHIQGHVCDRSSNAIPGVRVAISATRRVTGINHVFGTAPETFTTETNTDANGGFTLQAEAAWIQVVLSKAGYATTNQNFQWIAEGSQDATNQNLLIFLDRN